MSSAASITCSRLSSTKQHAALPDHGAERIERRAAVRLGDVQRGADGRQHRRRGRHRRERHECRAARILRCQAAEQLDREARLACAAVSRHGEHARATAHAIRCGVERLLAAEQGRGGRRRRLEDRRGDIAEPSRTAATRCSRRARSGNAPAAPSPGSARRCDRGRRERRRARSRANWGVSRRIALLIRPNVAPSNGRRPVASS